MSVMTVKICQSKTGVSFETIKELPHKPGKYIAGFAKNEDDAKRRAIAYAGNCVEFVCDGSEKKIPNVELTGAAQLYRAASSDRRERG